MITCNKCGKGIDIGEEFFEILRSIVIDEDLSEIVEGSPEVDVVYRICMECSNQGGGLIEYLHNGVFYI